MESFWKDETGSEEVAGVVVVEEKERFGEDPKSAIVHIFPNLDKWVEAGEGNEGEDGDPKSAILRIFPNLDK